MASRKDFLVSYTSVDRPWAVWIAWQLEADGYQAVVQAWDFNAGSDWVHEMNNAMSTAERVVAILSPDYLNSAHGEAEWRDFYAKDPSGERRLLLPVRVREVNPPGLLKTRVYVDLVGLDVVAAREALLAAARGLRGKPPDEPEFPGLRERSEGHSNEAPQFPGDLPSAEGSGSEPFEGSSITLRADDVGAVKAFVARVSVSLRQREFSDRDIEAFRISLLELVHNTVNYVGGGEPVQLRFSFVDDFYYSYDEVLSLEVGDRGTGFDFERALVRSEAELLERGIEHGLLRAYRLGSQLTQVSTEPHVMSWVRERTPETVKTVFGGKNVIPFVVSYRDEVVLIWETVHTFFQFGQYLKRSPAFMDLIFDPLQRPTRKYVGIEITGQNWSGATSEWRDIIDSLLSFAKRNVQFDKQLLLFGDAGPPDQRELRKYCQRAGIVMFEDKSVIRNLRTKDVYRIIRRMQEKKSHHK